MHFRRLISIAVGVLVAANMTQPRGLAGPATSPADAVAALPAATQPAPELAGCWRQGQPLALVRFEPGRMVLWQDGKLVVKKAGYQPGSIRLTSMGQADDAAYEVSPTGKTLTLRLDDDEVLELSKLADLPAELDLRPMELPAPAAVDADEVKAVAEQLRERIDADQAVRMKMKQTNWSVPQPGQRPATQQAELIAEMMKVDADNTAFIEGLIRKRGWIDASRFGPESSRQAFLLVQHSGDIRMMLAVLPQIRKDVDAGRLDGQGYAMLYDRLHVRLGEPQRYGTQATKNEHGQIVILEIEDRQNVDELRRKIGIKVPLAQYVELMKKMYGAKDAIFEGDPCAAVSATARGAVTDNARGELVLLYS